MAHGARHGACHVKVLSTSCPHSVHNEQALQQHRSSIASDAPCSANIDLPNVESSAVVAIWLAGFPAVNLELEIAVARGGGSQAELICIHHRRCECGVRVNSAFVSGWAARVRLAVPVTAAHVRVSLVRTGDNVAVQIEIGDALPLYSRLESNI